MFCSECGTKNEVGNKFCQECGSPLETNSDLKEQSTKNEEKTRKPLSRKNKIILGVLFVVVIICGVGYKVGSDLTNPKTIAKDYIQAVIDLDGNKLYSYLELEGDKTFVSKEIYTQLLKENDTDISNVENYKITGVEYGNGNLTAKVKFTYTMKGSSEEIDSSVNLTKQKEKKYIFFDDWKISDLSASSATLKDFTIKSIKGSTITFAGVSLSDNYLDSKSSTSKFDVYVLPQVFTTETKIQIVLPMGMEIEERVTPSSYRNSYTVDFSEENLTEASQEQIELAMKDVLTNLYTNAIRNTTFNDIKANYEKEGLDLTNLEKNYNELVSSLMSSSTKLTEITFNTTSLSELELNDDGYLEVQVRADYSYRVEYTSWSEETETHQDTDSDYMTLILGYQDGSYYLVDISDLTTYFSRY